MWGSNVKLSRRPNVDRRNVNPWRDVVARLHRRKIRRCVNVPEVAFVTGRHVLPLPALRILVARIPEHPMRASVDHADHEEGYGVH